MEGILNRAGLEPIVLNRMANGGLTLIEKFEKYSDVKYAIILLTQMISERCMRMFLWSL